MLSGNMETFPDSLESTAADALLHLLLNAGEDDQNSSSITSSSSSTSTTINTGSSGDVSRRVDDPLLLLQFAAHHQLVYESKFQSLIRRRRTKVYFVAAQPESSHSKGAASTVSTASVCSPRGPTVCDIDTSPAKKPVGVKMGSKRVQRAAGNISKLLAGGGTFSEFQIREALGDSPDTSKALRLLLKLHEVKRSGDGGKSNPYMYEVASQCSGVDSA